MLSLKGNTFFQQNLAKGDGGAINFSSGTLTLDADVGAIAFSGNKQSVTFDADGKPVEGTGISNSIGLSSNSKLDLKGSGNIYFDDPIRDGGDANSLVKSGSGFVQFVGDNVWDGIVDVNAGTFRVVTDASFGSTNTARVVVASGATLAGGGTIGAGTWQPEGETYTSAFTISGTLSPDSDRFEIPEWVGKDHAEATATDYNYFRNERTEIAADKKIGTLTLIGNTTLDGATLAVDIDGTSNDRIAVDGEVTFGSLINTVAATFSDTVQLGEYTFLTTTGGAADPTGKFAMSLPNSTLGGYNLTARGSGVVRTNSNRDLALKLVLDNTVLTWTGAEGNLWTNNPLDPNSGNWTDGDAVNPETKFRNGDAVVFDNTSSRTTVALGTNVTVADMTVTGGATYTFVGTGGVTGATNQSGGITATGKLFVTNSSTAVFDNSGTNGFVETNIDSGSTVRLAGTPASGTGNFGGAIVNDGFFEITRSGSYTLNNTISGDGVTKMTGTGTLTIGGTGTSQSNAFEQTSGIVNLTNQWTGNYTQTGGVLTGNGTVAGNLVSAKDIRPGDETANGIIAVTGNADFSNATLRFKVNGSISDQIVVDGTVDVTSTVIDILNFTPGTYTLLTGGNNFFVTQNQFDASLLVGGSAKASRQTVTFDNAIQNEVKVTLGINGNATLTWAGNTGDLWRSANRWTKTNLNDETFIDGDTVVFNDPAGPQTVGLGTSDVTVAGMTVNGGDYTFTGDGVGFRTNGSGTKKLDMRGGKVILANTGTSNFTDGIEIGQYAQVQLGNNNNGGTLDPAVTITITNNGDLVFSRNDNFTFENTITGAGTVTQSGFGTVTLNGSSQGGSLHQNRGTINLATTWTGGFSQDGGKLTGSGALTGTADIKGTVAPTGVLTLQDDVTFRENSTLHVATLDHATNTADKLMVSRAITFVPGDDKIGIDLGQWEIVTGAVIIDASIADTLVIDDTFKDITLNGFALSGRQKAELSVSGGDLLLTTSAKNGSLTWTGAMNDRWDTTEENWTGIDTKFIDGDTVTFDDTTGYTTIFVQNTGVKVESMTVDAATSNYVFNSGGITASGKLTKSGAGTLTLNQANDFQGGTDFQAGTIELGHADALGMQGIHMQGDTTLSFKGGYTLANNIVFHGDANFDTASHGVTLNGILEGDSGFTKTGTGTLTLYGTNRYGGGTTIDAGKIVAKNASALGTGTVDIGANTLDLDFSGTLNTGNVISGTGTLNIKNNVEIAHANTGFTGTTNVDSGKTLTLGNSNALEKSSVKLASGSTFAVKQASTAGSLTASGATIVLEDIDPAQEALTATNFTLTGSNTVKINTDTAGTYVLLSSTNAVSAWNSNVVNDDNTVRGAQQTTDNELLYRILDGAVAADLIWTGAAGSNWNTTDVNWTDADGYRFNFASGDNVVFDSTASNKSITVDSSGVDVGAMTVSDAYNFSGGQIRATGIVKVASTGRLGLVVDETAESLTANSVVFDTGSSLNITGYTGTAYPAAPITVVKSDTAITALPSYTIAGQQNVDFLSSTLQLDNEKKKLQATVELTWYSTASDRPAHGNFTIADGQTFTLGADLNATTTNLDPDWDGKSLTKLGTGTLILTGDNTTDGDLNHELGTIDLRSDWNGRYLQATGTKLYSDDNISIGKTGTTSVLSGEINPAGTLNVAGNLELDGATLNVDIVYNDTTNTADKIVAQGDVTVSGGELHVNDESKIVVENVRQTGSVDFTVLESTNGEVTGRFTSLTGFESGFFKTSHAASGNRYLITVGYNPQAKFVDYSWNHNTNEIARNLDASMNDPAMQALINGIIGNDALILAGLDTLRGTELHADAQSMALWNPWDIVYKRLYADTTSRELRSRILGQCGTRPSNRDAWVEGYYRDTDVRRDGNASKYDGRRGGTMVGLDSHLNCWSKIGVVFGYGEPKASNRFGKIEADDYTFGLYSKVRVVDNLYANAFLGYGSQRYESKRTDITGFHKAKYDGDSMYASLELFRPLNWRRNATLFPLFALDYQRSWTDGFTESGDYGQKVAKADMDRFVMRIGLNSKIRWNDRLNVSTRLQYGYLLGGDVHGVARTQFAAASPTSPVMGLRGVNLGRNQFNVGLGGEWKLTNRTRLFGDYDFDLGDRSTAHTGQFGLVTNW